MKGKLRKMFEGIYIKLISQLPKILDNAIVGWRENKSNIDDIVIIGVRL